MGLQEKRAIKSFEENQFPGLKDRMLQTLGFDVDIEVKWNTLDKNINLNNYEEAFAGVYFEPTIKAFEGICSDDMGKEALQEVLKKIVIQDESGIFSAHKWMKFEDGILTLDHESCVNFGAVDDRAENLQELLENSL